MRGMARIRERSWRRAYGRIYPGLLWDNASDIGREEARKELIPEDVFAVVESMLTLGELVDSQPIPDARIERPEPEMGRSQ